jgi:hypothetical protein
MRPDTTVADVDRYEWLTDALETTDHFRGPYRLDR